MCRFYFLTASVAVVLFFCLFLSASEAQFRAARLEANAVEKPVLAVQAVLRPAVLEKGPLLQEAPAVEKVLPPLQKAPDVLLNAASPFPKLSPREITRVKSLIKRDCDYGNTIAQFNEECPPPVTERRSIISPNPNPVPLQKQPWGYTLGVGEFTNVDGWFSEIPSPTWYDGYIYISGGIASRQFYCFDPYSGDLAWRIQVGNVNADRDTILGPSDYKYRYKKSRQVRVSIPSSSCEPSSGTIADNICVFNGATTSVYAVDARTGKLLWSKFLGRTRVTPMIHDGKVYTSYSPPGMFHQEQFTNTLTTMKGARPQVGAPVKVAAPTRVQVGKKGNTFTPTYVLACLDLKTGEEIWQSWLDGDVLSSPVLNGDKVLITTLAGTVHQFDAKDGTILYTHRGNITSAPVAYNEDELLITRRRDILLRGEKKGVSMFTSTINPTAPQTRPNVETFEVLERFKDQGRNRLEIHGQRATSYLGLVNYGAASERTIVGPKAMGILETFQGSRPVVDYDGTIYCAMDDRVVAINSSGEKIWERQVPRLPKKKEVHRKQRKVILGPDGFLLVEAPKKDPEREKRHFLTPPALAAGKLFLGTQDGRLIVLDKSDGKLTKDLFLADIPISSQMVVMEGLAFVPTERGLVHVVKLPTKKYTGWVAWGGNMQHTSHAPKPAAE